MAIKKTIEFNNGATGNYIRIVDINLRNGSNEGMVKVHVWKDAETRNTEGKVPLFESNFGIEMVGEGDYLTRCYNGLKNLSDFWDSEDV